MREDRISMRRLAYLLQIHSSGADADTGKGTSDIGRRNFKYLLTSHAIGFTTSKTGSRQLPYQGGERNKAVDKSMKTNMKNLIYAP